MTDKRETAEQLSERMWYLEPVQIQHRLHEKSDLQVDEYYRGRPCQWSAEFGYVTIHLHLNEEWTKHGNIKKAFAYELYHSDEGLIHDSYDKGGRNFKSLKQAYRAAMLAAEGYLY